MLERPNLRKSQISIDQLRTIRGFTLVELLVCIGIIALLISILLPAINGARRSGRLVVCASNVRQLCAGMMIYASSNKGAFPINVATPMPMYWFNHDRIGKILKPSRAFDVLPTSAQTDLQGGVAACPDDFDGIRSYSMNIWASSAIDSSIVKANFGVPWKASIKPADRYILIAEKWSTALSNGVGWVTVTTLASGKDTPGRLFGGGPGIRKLIAAPHSGGQSNSELPFARHRGPRGKGGPTEALGRINIGYADGHVALKSNTELVNPDTGLSTLDSLWSPVDAQKNVVDY